MCPYQAENRIDYDKWEMHECITHFKDNLW